MRGYRDDRGYEVLESLMLECATRPKALRDGQGDEAVHARPDHFGQRVDSTIFHADGGHRSSDDVERRVRRHRRGGARLFRRQRVARFQAFERTALRRLALLNQIRSLDDLKSPGFRLEALRGDRAGQYSIRINDQWRVCFRWQDGDATDVEIVDYH